MYPYTVPAGWAVKNVWDEVIVPKAVALLRQEQDYKARMSAMRARLTYIAQHPYDLSNADYAESEQLEEELKAVGVEFANFLQVNFRQLEAAVRCGLKA